MKKRYKQLLQVFMSPDSNRCSVFVEITVGLLYGIPDSQILHNVEAALIRVPSRISSTTCNFNRKITALRYYLKKYFEKTFVILFYNTIIDSCIKHYFLPFWRSLPTYSWLVGIEIWEFLRWQRCEIYGSARSPTQIAGFPQMFPEKALFLETHHKIPGKTKITSH